MKSLQIMELAVVVIAKNYSPMLLNIDFLKSSALIPEEWQLTQEPVCTKEGSQLVFNNRINLVALPDRLTFVEAVEGVPTAEIQVVDLAKRYVESLPNLEYVAVGINPKGHVTFADRAEAEAYINTKLLAPGSWQKFGNEPVKASLRLSYTLERSKFFLSVDGASLRMPGQDMDSSVIIFSGNFNCEVTQGDRLVRVQAVNEFLSGWNLDLETYRDLIENSFFTK